MSLLALAGLRDTPSEPNHSIFGPIDSPKTLWIETLSNRAALMLTVGWASDSVHRRYHLTQA